MADAIRMAAFFDSGPVHVAFQVMFFEYEMPSADTLEDF